MKKFNFALQEVKNSKGAEWLLASHGLSSHSPNLDISL